MKSAHEGLSKGVAGAGELEGVLNRLGAEGWELVNVVNDRVVFERPAKD